MAEKRAIEVTIGKSSENRDINLCFPEPNRNHCLITGRVGSGKSTLLGIIIKQIQKNYSNSQAIIWANTLPCVNDCCCNASLSVFNNDHNADNKEDFVSALYEELQRRIRILSREGTSFYYQANLPLIFAIIDDFRPDSFASRYNLVKRKLEEIIRMSHAVGLSLIIASQMPPSMLGTFSLAIAEMISIRIALNAPPETIYDALGITLYDASAAEKETVERLSKGKVGDFIIYNRYGYEPIQYGHFTSE